MIFPLAILVAGGTFIHYWQVKTPTELTDHYKTYKLTVSGFEKESNKALFEKYAETLPEGFLEEYQSIQIQKDKNYAIYRAGTTSINEKYKIFNFPSSRQFLFMLSLIAIPLITSIFLIIAINTRSVQLKSNLRLSGYVLLGISSFWMFWVFFNHIIRQNNWWYVAMFLAVSCFASYLVGRTIQYYTYKRDKIQTLVSFIFRVRFFYL